ncbi:MAG: universal stress protein [Rhodospirillales bacterium]|nr:universal stress protein [Rhodospirillales bacterium]
MSSVPATAHPKHLLVPMDGSENALRALSLAIAMIKDVPGGKIELVNAQTPLGQGVSMFVARAEVKGYHRDEGMRALGPALDAAKAAGVAHAPHIGVGGPGEVVAGFCKELGCDHIVMGTRGLGSGMGLLLGSVATDVVHHASVPVTLVK